MSIKFNSTSRYKQTEIVNKNGKESFGMYAKQEFLKPGNLQQNEIMTIKITNDIAGRPDLIAEKIYDTRFLDWVIIMYNKPLNTIGWPKVGTTIQTPTKSTVLRNL